MSQLCVIASSSVPAGVRGALTQWLLEIMPGLFVGRVSGRIREYLWSELSTALALEEGTYAALVRQDSNSEQGFSLTTVGNYRYEIEDFQGISLVTRIVRQFDDEDPFEGLPDPMW